MEEVTAKHCFRLFTNGQSKLVKKQIGLDEKRVKGNSVFLMKIEEKHVYVYIWAGS